MVGLFYVMINVGTSHMDPVCYGMLFECLLVQRHIMNMSKQSPALTVSVSARYMRMV